MRERAALYAGLLLDKLGVTGVPDVRVIAGHLGLGIAHQIKRKVFAQPAIYERDQRLFVPVPSDLLRRERNQHCLGLFRNVQRPRVFYRRELEANPLVIAKP